MGLWKLILAAVIATAGMVDAASSSGQERMREASRQGKHLFLFFYGDSTASTQKMERVFDQAVQDLGSQALSVKISVTDPSERSIIEKFGLRQAPMPLALVLAPNGVMVRGFPKQFSEEQLKSSLVTPAMASCLKALQEQKMVFLCIQGQNTKNNSAALRGVQDFQSDSRFSTKTEVIVIDPQDRQEESLIKELGLSANLAEATTIMMSPPAETVGRFVGPTSKQMIVSKLQNATKGCGPGGCPDGCK